MLKMLNILEKDLTEKKVTTNLEVKKQLLVAQVQEKQCVIAIQVRNYMKLHQTNKCIMFNNSKR